MSIKIYWGANGSYKSASAVEYDIIPELKKGRTVVTNIRGCTLERILQVYPDLPEQADVINIDEKQLGAREKLRTWFRWAPKGALVVLDEVQLIHLKAWKDRDLEKYKLKVKNGNGQERLATEEEAEQLGEPYDMLDAFTRHRHFNWDLVLMTPNIQYIRSDIRMTSETAYYQGNWAVIGIKGRFRRVMHNANDNKPSAGCMSSTEKINQRTFKCYESTATGRVQDTRAGTPFWKNKYLVCMVVGIVAFWGYAIPKFYNSHAMQVAVNTDDEINTSGHQISDTETVEGVQNASGNGAHVSRVQNANAVGNRFGLKRLPFEQFEAVLWYQSAANGFNNYFVEYSNDDGSFNQSFNDLKKLGYNVQLVSECVAVLSFEGQSRVVHCFNEYYQEAEKQPESEPLLSSL